MKYLVRAGRFQRGAEWNLFYRTIHRIAVRSLKHTTTEMQIQEIRDRLREDVKKHVKPHSNGLDPKSIVREKISGLFEQARAEVRELQIETIREEIAALEELMRSKESQLSELTRSGGSVVFLNREREIRDAWKNLELPAVKQAID